MPFKTKKQKLRAGSRRITISAQGLATYGTPDKLADKVDKSLEKNEQLSHAKDISYRYVNSDIVKTVLFALAIIGLQLIIKFSNITF